MRIKDLGTFRTRVEKPGRVVLALGSTFASLTQPMLDTVSILHLDYCYIDDIAWYIDATKMPCFAVFEDGKLMAKHKLMQSPEMVKALIQGRHPIEPQENNYMAPGDVPWDKKPDPRYFAQPEKPKQPEFLKHLDAMVGMGGPKSEITRLASIYTLAEKRRAAGLPFRAPPMNYLFTGNPGTGKTTFARHLSSALRYYEALPRGHIVELDRAQLVGKYIGHTESITLEKLKEALGGTLLVDEAYALCGEGNDYGQRAIDTIVKFTSDNKEVISVVLAGYPDKMKQLLTMNPGLKSRFATTIHFPDFTPEELLEVFDRQRAEHQFTLSDDAAPAVWQAIKSHYSQRGQDFGNARDMDTFFETVLRHMAVRVTRDDAQNVQLIEKADIDAAALQLGFIGA